MLSPASSLSPAQQVMFYPWVTRQENHRQGNTNIYLKRKPKVNDTQKKHAGEERKGRNGFIPVEFLAGALLWLQSFSLVDIISLPAPQSRLDPPGNDRSQ